MSSFVGMNSMNNSDCNFDANLNKRPVFPNTNRGLHFGSKNIYDLPMVGKSKEAQHISQNNVQDGLHSNTSANNNFSLNSASNTEAKVPESPDYRTLLQLRRLNQKKFNSNDDSDLSESSEEETEAVTRKSTSDTSVNSQVSNNNEPKLTLEGKKENGDSTSEKEQPRDSVLLKISVPDQKITKCLNVDANDTAWTVKLRVIQTLSLKLSDPLNYGFYCKKLGRFLLDHKPLSEYVECGSVVFYELLYKRKIPHQVKSSKESRQLIKMQSSSKQRELLAYVVQRNTDKIYSLIRKGVDPNFHTLTEETPLTTAAGTKEKDRKCSPVIMALVGGGAHLDFRNKKGLTPVHVAARTGNVVALKTLLDLGASTDVLDDKDLSPLYHCGYFGSSVECLNVLIQCGAKIDCVDAQGWTVLHQVCKNGKLALLQIFCEFLRSAQDSQAIMDAKNATGNTALHVCALYNQELCLALLLKQGADPTVRNFANQDIFQVAVVAGNMQLANFIKNYEIQPTPGAEVTEETEPFRRHTVTATSLAKFEQPRSMIGTSFSKGKREKTNRFDSYLPPGGTLPKNSITTRAVTLQAVRTLPDKPLNINNLPLNINNTVPDVQKPPKNNAAPEFVFIACQDYQAHNENELNLAMGERVTVISHSDEHTTAPEGFVTALVADRTGFVPKDYIQAVKLRKPRPALELGDCYGPNESSSENRDSFQSNKSDQNMKSDFVATADRNVFHQHRDVILNRGHEGYGFILRGAKSDGPIESFVSTPSHPALQYLESVEVGSNAYQAGLRSGDFVLQVNNTDVSCIGHRQIVETIKNAGTSLRMRVVKVIFNNDGPQKESSDDVKSVSSTVSSQESGSNPSSYVIKSAGGKVLPRSGSIGSAIGQLDSVLALEESGEEGDGRNTATLRRRPISRRMRTQDIEEIFLRNGQETTPASGHSDTPVTSSNRVSQSLSSATSRRLIRVLPPKLPKPVRPAQKQGIAIDEVVERERTRTFSPPANHVFHPPEPDYLPQGDLRAPHNSTFNHSRTTSASSSGSSVGNSRKPPPAPPQRRSSKLTGGATEEPHMLPVFPQNPGVSPTVPKIQPVSFVPQQYHNNPPVINNHHRTSSTKTPPPILTSKPMSGIAAAVAAAAQYRKTRLDSVDSSDSVQTSSSCPSPVVPSMPAVAPVLSKPPAPVYTQPVIRGQNAPTTKTDQKSASSALLMALAAKRASLENKSGNKPSRATVAAHTTNNNERFSLPPPPPTPPGEKNFELPPPPSGGGDPLRLDELFLPPPPDSLLADDSFPPPSDFASDNKGFGDINILPPVKYKDEPTANPKPDDFLPKQTTDSGVTSLNSNMETMSLGSTLSTMSSEDGSDVGVSFSCQPRPSEFPGSASEILRKINSQNAAAPGPMALTKIQFGGVHKTSNPAAHRRDVTQAPVAEKVPVEKAQNAADSKPGVPRKTLKSWTSDDVTQWLHAIGLSMHAQVFAENEIVGSHLPELDKDDLSELGVTRVGHRITIEKSLKALK